MWGACVCSSPGNLTSAIIYYQILSKTNNVEKGDFHRSSARRMIFQCTASKLKLLSQSCHSRTLSNIVTLCPNPSFVDFVRVSSFFVRILTIALDFCHVHDFVEVDLFFRVPCSAERLHRPVLSRIQVWKNKLYNDTNLLRLTQNIHLVLWIYWPPLVHT